MATHICILGQVTKYAYMSGHLRPGMTTHINIIIIYFNEISGPEAHNFHSNIRQHIPKLIAAM